MTDSLKKKQEDNMDKLHAIYPGAFKPFHDGHYLQILKYLDCNSYDIDVTVIISSADREGIKADSTKNFMDKVFRKNNRVEVKISEFPTPFKSMYAMIDKGSGDYTMISSSKDDDMKRVDVLKKYYAKGSKTYKEGVRIIDSPVDVSPIMYDNRIDNNSDKEISSTIVRNDIRNNDFESFKTSYTHMLEDGAVSEQDLKNYFDVLSKEVLPYKDSALYDSKLVESYYNDLAYTPLNEGGAAGHMSHPYEVDSFTFGDLKQLNNDIFNAKIEHMTEKLDGLNLFASVDKKGRTVYARNLTDMKDGGMTLNDMASKWSDNPDVAQSFVTGGNVIDKVFRNIKDRTIWFNIQKRNNNYKLWVNCEIVNRGTENVIPYNSNCVYFHDVKMYVTKDHGADCYKQLGYDTDEELEVLKAASNKVQNSSITNEIIMNQIGNNNSVISKFNKKIDEIRDMYNVSDSDTLLKWKENALHVQLQDTEIGFIYKFTDLKKLLEKRWICNSKETNMKDIKTLAVDSMKDLGLSKSDVKDKLSIISKYDREMISDIMKKILKPLDEYFIDLGNEVIERCNGFMNQNNKLKVILKLKDEIKNTIQDIKNDNDPKKMKKLREQISRLKDAGDKVNATEGIVLNFKGKTIKLTGSFAAVNQIIGLKKYDK